MSYDQHQPWLLSMISAVRTRPELYIPGPKTASNFQAFLAGYVQARLDLGLNAFTEEEELLLEQFTDWARKKSGGTSVMGFADCLELSGSKDSMTRLFEEFETFLSERGERLPTLDESTWPPTT